MRFHTIKDDESNTLDHYSTAGLKRAKLRGISRAWQVDSHHQQQRTSDVNNSILRVIDMNESKVGYKPSSKTRSRIHLNISCNSIVEGTLPPTTTNYVSNKENGRRWRIKNVTNVTNAVSLNLYNRIQQREEPPTKSQKFIGPLKLQEQRVRVYEKEIWDHILERDVHQQTKYQSLCIPFPTYIEATFLQKLYSLRTQVVNMVAHVHNRLSLHQDTLFLTVRLFDQVVYSQVASLPTETEDIELLARFKLVGVASLFIASKLEEVYSAPALKDLVTYAGKASRQQVLDMEGTILQLVAFNLIFASPMHFLNHLWQGPQSALKLVSYVLELTLLDPVMTKYTSCNKALCSVLVVARTQNMNISRWEKFNRVLKRMEGSELQKCQVDMQNLYLRNAQLSQQPTQLNSITKKYLHHLPENRKGKMLRAI